MRASRPTQRQAVLTLILVLTCTSIAGCIRSFTLPSSPSATVEILGTVTSSDNEPISGAIVEVNQKRTMTNSDGTFVLRDIHIPDGRAWYTVSAPQHTSRTGSVAASRGAKLNLEITLSAIHSSGDGRVVGRLNFAAPQGNTTTCPAVSEAPWHWHPDMVDGVPALPPPSLFPPPNDECYFVQDHLTRVQAPWAWTQTTGSTDVIVAVLDTGVRPDHPDLEAHLLPGWNTFHGNDDTTDIIGSGTAAAGLIGAVGNNGIGVTGVAQQVSILPVRLANLITPSPESPVDGLIYAADNGADVIYFGYVSPHDPALQDAVEYAQAKGAIVVAPVGVGGMWDDPPVYPASYDGVIGVGALDPYWGRTEIGDFSSPSEAVDLVAPGASLWTTSTNDPLYTTATGTGPAAAVVSGVVALMLSNGIPPWEIEEVLYRTAVRIGDPENNLDDRHTYGYGLVNAYAAVLNLDPMDAVLFVVNEAGEIVSNVTSPDAARLFTVTGVPQGDHLTLVGWIDVNQNGLVDVGDYYGLAPVSLQDGDEVSVELPLGVYNLEQPLVHALSS